MSPLASSMFTPGINQIADDLSRYFQSFFFPIMSHVQ